MHMLDSEQRSGSILAVVVLYGVRGQNTETFRTLEAANANRSGGEADVSILLYDNTPGGTTADFELPRCVRYYAAGENRGVAGAYNYALRMAEQEGCSWLLTLDQDTSLPLDFLMRMREIAQRLCGVNEVGAIVPHLVNAGRVLSPVRIRPWGVSYLPLDAAGFAKGEIHAFNSGSLFRVSALKQIGGFDGRFWLDYQDASVYRRLHQCGKQVYIAEGVNVQHDLSLISEQKAVAPERFRNFLAAESAYTDLYRGRVGGTFLTLRLLGRIWRQWRKETDIAIRQLTHKAFQNRILRSRNRRMADWNREMQIRVCGASGGRDKDHREERPTISVCMAAYNGERYIAAQLQSILSQLGPDDEVLIVDDASTDGTRGCVQSLGDSRIRLIEHSTNRGVSHTFEDAIRGASGRILFLSDQDDLWDPRKVSIMLEAFRSHPEVTLIATDNALIDADGNLIVKSYFAGRGRFRAGLWPNLIRNRFGGCTMAFRAEVISEILPFPHRYEVLHDLWIGVRNSLSGHKTLYIPEPLVLNRRHAATATGRGELKFSQKVRIRAHLLLALAELRIRRVVL
jgi:GT2 family glycosyltransferase